jgi:hypothetical protein
MQRAVVYRTALGSLLSAAAVCFVTTATAKPKAKHSEAATEAFKQCREKEKQGPAPRCWQAWLEFYRDKGTEAEVIVAEDHSKQAAATPSSSAPAKPAPKPAAEPAPEEPEQTTAEEPAEASASVSVTPAPEPPPAPAEPPPPPVTYKLGAAEGVYGTAAGKAEGLRVGSSFIVQDANGKRTALLKVERLGPGGAEGAEQATELKLRLGQADNGADLVPLKMIGLSAMLGPSLGILLPGLSTGNTWFPRDQLRANTYLQFKLPQVYVGAGLSVGYDVSGLISLSESNVRLRGEYLSGMNGIGTRAKAVALDLTFEKGFDVAKMLQVYGGLGPTLTIATVETLPPDIQIPDQPNSAQTLKAYRFGVAANVGLEALVHPNVGMRLEGFLRGNVPTEGYISADGGPVYWDFHKRKDSFSMVGVRLGVIGMF